MRVEKTAPAPAVDDPRTRLVQLSDGSHKGAGGLEVHGLVRTADGGDEHVSRPGRPVHRPEIGDVTGHHLHVVAHWERRGTTDHADHRVATARGLHNDATAKPASRPEDHDLAHRLLPAVTFSAAGHASWPVSSWR